MPPSGFDLLWPWIGLGFTGVLVVLLFATNLLRGARSGQRWQGPRWLSFLAIAVYLLHQFEEYGVAANGVRHAFLDGLCATLGQPPYPGCSIPPVFYVAVNISLVGIAALRSRRFPLVRLARWGVIAVNALVHVAGALANAQYNAGLVTAALLFVHL